jgi:UDP-N-acetyl-D-mannosaminuronate dehydrogenase
MTFKENVPDLRNTRAADVVAYLQEHGVRVSVWEPLVGAARIKKMFGLETLTYEKARNLDAVIVINRHDAFRCIELPALKAKMRTPVLVDVKNLFPRAQARKLGFRYVSL